MIEGGRIPIYSDLTLNVSTTGNDATGGLDSPFATPQIAYDWVVANCDFKCANTLKIKMDDGNYPGITINRTISGLNMVHLTGNGDNTIVSDVYIDTMNILKLGDLTISSDNKWSLLFVGNSRTFVEGTLKIVSNTGNYGILLFNGGILTQSDNNSVIDISGNFVNMFHIEKCSTVNFENANIVVNGAASSAVFYAQFNSSAIVSGTTFSGNITNGAKYVLQGCSVLYTGGSIAQIPGSAGSADSSCYTN